MFHIGWVIRDDRGQFVRGKVKRMEGCVSVMEAEAIGVWETLNWMKMNDIH